MFLVNLVTSSDTEHVFMSIDHLYVLFGTLSIQGLCLLLNWIVCFFGVIFKLDCFLGVEL